MPVRAPADARPGTGRCFMSQNATGEKRHVFAEERIAFTLDISLLKTKKHKFKKIYFAWAAEDD